MGPGPGSWVGRPAAVAVAVSGRTRATGVGWGQGVGQGLGQGLGQGVAAGGGGRGWRQGVAAGVSSFSFVACLIFLSFSFCRL